MNVYDFINSETIARHCQELGHFFTPLQTACLINRSGRHTFEQKHRAYEWVIEHLPDEEADLGLKEATGSRTVSLRWFLKEYMRLERFCPENCFRSVWEEEQKKFADSRCNCAADMTAYGYFQDDNGRVYWECMHDYMSLEYYRGELNGKKRILKALGSFLKDEIDAVLLMNAYHILMSEEHIRQVREAMNITQEGLVLAGFAE